MSFIRKFYDRDKDLNFKVHLRKILYLQNLWWSLRIQIIQVYLKNSVFMKIKF